MDVNSHIIHSEPLEEPRQISLQIPQVGPFQYMQQNFITHPIQPIDDISMEDQTIKTQNKSKLSQSPYQLQMQGRSLDQSQFHLESSVILQFSDRSYDSTLLETKKIGRKFIEKLKERVKMDFSNNPFLERTHTSKQLALDPNHIVSKIWAIFYLMVLLIAQIYLPLMEFTVNRSALFVVFKIFDIFYILNSQIIENDQFISDRLKILDYYKRKYLIIDLIGVIAIIVIAANSLNRYVVIVIFILSCQQRQSEICLHLQFQEYVIEKQLKLALSIIKLIIIVNYSICLWHNLIMDPNSTYIDALYDVVGMICLNASNINSSNNNNNNNNNNNKFIYSVFFIYSLIIFGFIIKLIILYPSDNQLPQVLGSFFQQNKVDANLKQKIIANLNNFPKYYHEQIYSKLSGTIIKELHHNQRYNYLSQFFKELRVDTLKLLTQICTDIITQPNQVIIQENTQDDSSLYFILYGQFDIVIKNDIKIGQVQTNYFGEYSFYTEMPRKASIVSKGVGRLIKLNRQDFISNLSYTDKQLFYSKKEKMILGILYPNKCYFCNSGQHYLKECPNIFYIPNYERVIKTYTYPHKQKRSQYQRSIKKTKAIDFQRRERRFKTLKALDLYRFAQQNMDELYQFYSENNMFTSASQSQLPYEEVAQRRDSLTSASVSHNYAKTTSINRQSMGRENSLPVQDNIFLNMEQDQEFSVLKGEMQADDFENVVRIQNQKRTFATAGFGQQSLGRQSIKDKSLNIIDEKESSEKDSFNNIDNIDESPPIIEEYQFQRRTEPKMTFNYNFETQMNELPHQVLQRIPSGTRMSSQRQNSLISNNLREPIRQSSLYHSGSIRQNSNRSQTYSPNLTKSNNPSSRSFFNQCSYSNIQRKSQSNSNKSNIPQAPISDLSDQKSVKSVKSKRKSSRKKSTKTGTKVSILPSSFVPFSGFENMEQYYGIGDFDRMQEFEIYLPYNNYRFTINQANRVRKEIFANRLSNYIFSYRIAYQLHLLKLKTRMNFGSAKCLK